MGDVERVTLRVFVADGVTYTAECLRHLADQQSIALIAPTSADATLGRARIVKATRGTVILGMNDLPLRTLDLTLDVLPHPNDGAAELDAALATATMHDGRYPVSMLFESVREVLPAPGRLFDRIRVHALVILADPAVRARS